MTTRAGEFDCLLLRLDDDGQVGPASVKDTNLRFISPEMGLVASVEGKRVSALLFDNTDTRIAMALQEPPAAGAGPTPSLPLPAEPESCPAQP